MTKVLITAAAEKAIREEAIGFFKPIGKERPNGDFEINLEYETLQALRTEMTTAESLSDVIIRVCKTFGKETN